MRIDTGVLELSRSDWAASYRNFAQIPHLAAGDWDGDGRPGLIITRINEPVLALAPRPASDGRTFAVHEPCGGM